MNEKLDHMALLVIQTNYLKQVAEESQLAFRSAQRELVGLMEENGTPTITAFEEESGLYYTGTLVKSETTEVDETALRKAVGPKMWEKITRRVLDGKKLEAYVVTGEITSATVNKTTVVKARNPYVRFTTKVGSTFVDKEDES